jgi:fluoride exporter
MGALFAVLIGGAIGGGLRLELDVVLPHTPSEFPWDTLLINVVGSFALALLISRVWPIAPEWVRAGLGPGLLGGFTTFSAVMVSMVTLATSGEIVLAIVYIVATLVLGFGAAALGIWVGRRRDAEPIVEVDE